MTARPPPMQRRVAGIRSSPACPRRPLTFRSEGETMIRTPLYAALLVALSQPVFAQSPASPSQPARVDVSPASAPVAEAPADADCRRARRDERESPRATAAADACIAALESARGPADRLPPRRAAGDAEHYFAADGAADGSDDAQATGENAVASGAGSV